MRKARLAASESREMVVDVVAVEGLHGFAHTAVETNPPTDRHLVVEDGSHECVGEAVAGCRPRDLEEEASSQPLVQRAEEGLLVEAGHALEHRQLELGPGHGSDPQGPVGRVR